MTRLKFFIVLFLFIESVSIAQNNYANLIKSRANLFANATKKHNFKGISSLTYPKLVKWISKDTLLNQLSNEMVALQKKALRYKSITFEEPYTIYNTNEKLYCIIPQKIIKFNSQGELTIDTFLFAISEDKAVTWYFLNENQFLKYKDTLFNKLNPEMEIPKNSSVYKRNKKFSSFDKPN